MKTLLRHPPTLKLRRASKATEGQRKKMNTKKINSVKSSEVGIRAKRIILQGKGAIEKNVKIAQVKGDELQKIAMKEYEKVRKQMDETAKKVGDYIKKNPKKAIAISAGIGAALGAVAGIIASAGGKKKK